MILDSHYRQRKIKGCLGRMSDKVTHINFSVVIPFHNAYHFFEETLASVKNQTYPASEVIVVIDGCGQQAFDFLERFDDITIISLAINQGPANARNIGVKAAKSNWIAFLDADDKWASNKLERQREYLIQNPSLSGCHTGINIFKENEILCVYNNKPDILTIKDLSTSSHVVPTSFVISKKAFDAINGFDTNMRCSEDHDLTVRLVKQSYNIGFLPEALSYLRREGHGNISSNGRRIVIGHLQLVKKHWHLFSQYKGSRAIFISKTFITAGLRSKGIERIVFYSIGRIITLLFNVGKNT